MEPEVRGPKCGALADNYVDWEEQINAENCK